MKKQKAIKPVVRHGKKLVMQTGNDTLELTKVIRYKSGQKKGQGKGFVFTNIAAMLGAEGGKARARNLTKEQIADIGRKGAAKRWGSKPKKGGK